MTRQQEQQIISLVVKIFQNVGIKRHIDKIDILKNYQIYFEICKVIFPQTMIQLLRFSQGPQSNAVKIQGVIDIVGKILQNDLYHISGEAIAEGKLSHIRNFLHILQLLSQNINKGNRYDEEVQSAPQNTRSISDYDQEGHYTVIGIDRQFEREFDDEDGNHMNHQESEEQDTKRVYEQRTGKQNEFQQYQTDGEDSQSQRPMNPVLDNKQQTSKKKFVKTKPKPHNRPIERIVVQQVKPKPYRPSMDRLRKKQQVNTPKLDEFIQRKQSKQQIRKKAKSNFVRKINNIIEDFQAKKLTDLKLDYNIWVRKHEIKTTQKQNQIQEENKERMQFTNQLILDRKKKINTLRHAKKAVNIMANLFKEQRNIWKGMKKAKEELQLQQIEAIIQGSQRDQELLREALMAGTSVKGHLQRSR